MIKKQTKKVEWEKLSHNEILEGKGFFISYNPNTNSDEVGRLLNDTGVLIGLMNGVDLKKPEVAEETALVKLDEQNVYYILDGDFRKQYTKLLPLGFKKCLEFYKSKPKQQSNWSTRKIYGKDNSSK